MNEDRKKKGRLRSVLDPLRNHRWLRVLSLFAALSLLTIFLVLPPTLRWGMEEWLESHGRLQAEVQEVDFNLFSGYMTVHSLVTERKNDGGMRWGRASFEFKWRPVFSKRIRLDDISLANARIDVVQETDGALYFGGLRVRDGEATRSRAADQKAGSAWEIGFGDINLRDVTLRYTDPAGNARQIVIESLHMDPFQSWNPSPSSSFNAAIALAGGSLAVDGKARPFGRDAGLQGNLRLQKISLPWITPLPYDAPIDDLTGTLAADAAFDIRIGDAKGKVEAQLDGEIALSNLSTGLPDADVGLTALTWSGTIHLAADNTDDTTAQFTAAGRLSAEDADLRIPAQKLSASADAIEVAGDFSKKPGSQGSSGIVFDGGIDLKTVSVRPVNGDLNLAQADRIVLRQVNLDGGDRIHADAAAIDNLTFLQRPGEPSGIMAHVLALPSVNLDSITMDRPAKRFSAQSAAITDARGAVLRGKTGQLEMVELLPHKEGKPPPEAQPTGWTWRVEKAELKGNGRLKYRDTSVDPAVDLDFSNVRATVQDLDSAAPEESVSLSVGADMGDHAKVDASGEVRPFARAISMDMNGELARVSLPELRAYTERYWGYSIRHGQLYADFHLLAQNARLDSVVKLHITSLALDRQRPEELDAITNQLGMPLNTALNLLRDGNGDIRLKLPVTGSFSKPSIGLSDIVATALRNAAVQAIKTAAVGYFAPLGAVYAATKVMDRMTALQLEPVYFPPGKSDITAESRDYLAKVAEKIEGRPESRMVICGITVPRDRRVLAPESNSGNASSSVRKAEEPVRDENSVDSEVSPEQRLLDLAENRSEAVRSFLVSQGIDAGRLPVCAPDFDEKKARPQAMLAL